MNAELSPKAAEIAAHARSLLTFGGYNSFSYADLSDRVRISKASIHHHFPSKAELVQAVVAMHRQDAREGMAALDRLANPLEELNAYVGHWAKCIHDDTSPYCICAMLAAELPTIPDGVADEVRGFFRDLAGWLAPLFKRGVAEGQFQLGGSPAVEAKAFIATIYGAMLATRALGDPRNFQAIVQPTIKRLTALS